MALLIKNLNGLAYASVKSRNGLAVASIKSINGLDATGGGAVEFDATVSPLASAFPGAAFFVDLAISNLTNGYIVAAFTTFNDGGATVDACEWDYSGTPIAMSLIASRSNAERQTRIYGLAVGNKSSGTYRVRVRTTGADFHYVVFSAASYQGVHQTVSVGTASTAQGNSTTPSVTVSGATGDMVVGCLYYDDSGTVTPGADQTERWDAGGLGAAGAYSDEAGAASVTHSYTINSQEWVLAAIALKKA